MVIVYKCGMSSYYTVHDENKVYLFNLYNFVLEYVFINSLFRRMKQIRSLQVCNTELISLRQFHIPFGYYRTVWFLL